MSFRAINNSNTLESFSGEVPCISRQWWDFDQAVAQSTFIMVR